LNIFATYLQLLLQALYKDGMRSRFVTKCLMTIVVVVAAVGVTYGLSRGGNGAKNNSGKLQIVAAENFWGSLVSQLGGSKVQVTSIVSDPNADPHEFESSSKDARLFATANYVVVNGAGYDAWADKLLAANPQDGRKELKVADLLGKKEGDNPHFWYNPAYVNKVVAQMDKNLIALDPQDKAYFNEQYQKLQASLADYQSRIKSIKQQFGGTKVAATEDIFAYLAQAAGLDLISPPAFIEAVAEGNDPSTGSVVQFQQQLESGQPKVLVYNEQTVTPLTTNMKKLAAEKTIPTVGVTETIQPPDEPFQTWMNAEVASLQNALHAKALGR
jgi:zinc/manganese transport system substrate-binding protein